jgi:hypothetical protein
MRRVRRPHGIAYYHVIINRNFRDFPQMWTPAPHHFGNVDCVARARPDAIEREDHLWPRVIWMREHEDDWRAEESVWIDDDTARLEAAVTAPAEAILASLRLGAVAEHQVDIQIMNDVAAEAKQVSNPVSNTSSVHPWRSQLLTMVIIVITTGAMK